jgi:hypothetical protein
MTGDVVVVPSAPALLPAYAGQVDPVAGMRVAALDAVRLLVSRAPTRVVVLGAAADPANVARGLVEPLSSRVARVLLDHAGFHGPVVEAFQPGPLPSLLPGDALLVLADGTARRGEKAPGHIDERAFAFDDALEAALGSADTEALRGLDARLGVELLCAGVPALQALGALAGDRYQVEMSYADDPFGVKYWVVRWQCES